MTSRIIHPTMQLALKMDSSFFQKIAQYNPAYQMWKQV